jgi:hypothetical protein
MRQIPCALGLAAILLFGGCHNFKGVWPASNPGQAQARPLPENIDAATLVRSLNDNAARLQSLQATDLTIDAREGSQPVGLTGIMNCQKPKNFRLVAYVLGCQAVDMGSNDQEFWYWISKADPPYLVHCSYQDLARGGVYLPFPFQPDWVLETLGMAEYNPSANYQVQVGPKVVYLIEQTTSAQGQPVRKVTVFDRTTAASGRPTVVAHQLQDANGKEICSAQVSDLRLDQASGALYPHVVKLTWPAQKIEMKMTLDGVRLNGLQAGQPLPVFQRPQLRNVREVDLARLPAQPTGQVQRVRGSMR